MKRLILALLLGVSQTALAEPGLPPEALVHRKAVAERSASEATASMAELAAVRFDVQEVADSDFARASAAWHSWVRSREGMKAQVAAVIKMRRGYDLAAMDLSDLLLAERQTHDAFRAEAIARTEALRAITQIRIDSHNL